MYLDEKYALNLKVLGMPHRAFKRQFKGKYGVYLSNTNQAVIASEHTRKTSLAALLANAYPHILVISESVTQSEESTKYWLGLITDHAIMPTGSTLVNHDPNGDDVPLSGDQFIDKISLLESMPLLAQYLKNHVEITKDNPLHIVLNFFDANLQETIRRALKAKDIPLKRVKLSKIADELPKKTQRHCQLKRIQPTISKGMMVLGAVVLIGGYLGYEYQENTHELALEKQHQREQNAIIIKQRQLAEKRLKANFNERINALNAYHVLFSITQQLKHLVYLSNGWVLSSLSFTEKDVLELQLTYQRLSYGTVDSLLSFNKRMHSNRLDIDASGNKAHIYLKLIDTPSRVITNAKFKEVNQRLGAASDLISRLQDNHLSYRLSELSHLKQAKEVLANMGDIQNIKVTGKNITQLTALLMSLKNDPFTVIKGLNIRFDQQHFSVINQFNFTGVIYE